jgi:hypothetical protein
MGVEEEEEEEEKKTTYPSRTHHRYDDCRTASRIPNVSGRYRVHLAVSNGSDEAVVVAALMAELSSVIGSGNCCYSGVRGTSTYRLS